ncbi:hypothetical protein QBC36DRAFT_45512 [Triangularia setosa]|uniref:Uncharacterized protein n=1 Tax=Triangularia setosa TaxID=2587417 RepID=A0AAN6W3D0_9PEZI|nr:hypothetical protein QBC36DRAFT_45512 [Podospora setosa]
MPRKMSSKRTSTKKLRLILTPVGRTGAPKKPTVAATSSNTTPAPSSKRKQPHASASDDDLEKSTPIKKQRVTKPKEEKRLRRFRSKPPQSFHELYSRALTQRFFILSRTGTTPSSLQPNIPPSESIELTGSTGNIYTITISSLPSCTCPHFSSGKAPQCKHIIYVLSRVLRAKFDYVYQLAFLTSELDEIFASAPPIINNLDSGANSSDESDGKRKPIAGDCPICFEEFDANDNKKEEIVWCKAACGQNIHKQCFDMWAATKKGQGRREVTCPYCRSVWQKESEGELVKKVQKEKGKKNADGYVNVAEQLGISPVRDTSSYSRWWSGHPSGYRSDCY